VLSSKQLAKTFIVFINRIENLSLQEHNYFVSFWCDFVDPFWGWEKAIHEITRNEHENDFAMYA